MKLPHRVDLEELVETFEDLQGWVDSQSELFAELVLISGEELVQTWDDVTIIEFIYEDEVAIDIWMNVDQADEAMSINEEHWVATEEYGKAARARDVREYIKKRQEN